MMNREEMIEAFRNNDGNGFETVTIETDDKGRWIILNTYFYNPGADEVDEDGNDLDWRQVDEYVCMKLDKFIDMRRNKTHISNAEESNNRPCDEIYDLTEKQAVEKFIEILDELPFISADDIIMDTPDGIYLSQPF